MPALFLLSQGRTFATAFLPPFAPRCAFSAFFDTFTSFRFSTARGFLPTAFCTGSPFADASEDFAEEAFRAALATGVGRAFGAAAAGKPLADALAEACAGGMPEVSSSALAPHWYCTSSLCRAAIHSRHMGCFETE